MGEDDRRRRSKPREEAEDDANDADHEHESPPAAPPAPRRTRRDTSKRDKKFWWVLGGGALFVAWGASKMTSTSIDDATPVAQPRQEQHVALPPDPTPPPKREPPKPPPVRTANLNEEFKLGQYAYAITDVDGQASIGNSLVQEKAGSGAMFVVVKYRIENLGNQTETVMADDFRIVDSQGRQFRPSSKANTALAMSGRSKDLILAEVQPGVKHDMATVFEMPESAARAGFNIVVPEKGMLGHERVEIGVRMQ